MDFGEAKKISYAASIGTEYIPNIYVDKFINLIKKLDAVSVREIEAKELIEKMCNLKCDVSVDPTLLLSKEEWDKLTGERMIKDKYIIYYALHRSSTSEKLLNKLKKELKCKIITVTTSTLPCIGDIVIRDAGPIEFLNLYKYSEFAVNASFHGTVFSIIFEKPFYTMSYGPGKARIRTLLSAMGLENRIYFEGKIPEGLTDKIDYTVVKEKLTKEVERSKKYLYDNLRR